MNLNVHLIQMQSSEYALSFSFQIIQFEKTIFLLLMYYICVVISSVLHSYEYVTCVTFNISKELELFRIAKKQNG